MTREEAVRKVIDSQYGSAAQEDVSCQAEAHAKVREYVALGMLKLDEPKSVKDKIQECFNAEGYGFLGSGEFLQRMDD